MYQTHLLSLILNFITRDTEVVWHFRSDISQYQEGTITKRASLSNLLVLRQCPKLFLTAKGKQNHLASGICANKILSFTTQFALMRFDIILGSLVKSLTINYQVRKIIGFLGRNAPIKNCSQLLQVLKIGTRFPDTELHLVGRGFDAQDFQNQIRS